MANRRIKLRRVTGHFVALTQPSDTTGKYGMRVVLPANHPQQKEVAQAFAEVGQEAFGDISNVRFSLRNAEREQIDYEKSPELRGSYFFACNSKTRPGIVNQQVVPATDDEIVEFGYSGAEYNITVNVASYDFQGKGVTAYLGNVMLLGGGKRIGGGVSAEADFAEFRGGGGGQSAPTAEEDIPF